MKAILFILSLAIACLPGVAMSGEPQLIGDFHYSASLSGPLQKGALYRTPLTAEILRNCGSDCRDLRIIDETGVEIPYVVVESRGRVSGGERYRFEIKSYEGAKGEEIVTMGLPERHHAISSMFISTRDKDFRKRVQIYGSYDLKEWSMLSEDNIWDFSSRIDLRKTEVKIPLSDHRYFRLVLRNIDPGGQKDQDIRLTYKEGMGDRELAFSIDNVKAGRFRIDGVEGVTPSSGERPVYDEMAYSGFTALKSGNCTLIDIETAIPFQRLTFNVSNAYYFRRINIYFSPDGKEESYRLITSGQIYSFPLANSNETRNLIDAPASGTGHYRITIDNGSNVPLDIRGITLGWVRKDIYFIALGDSPRYTLLVGNPFLKRPEYDLMNFINQGNAYQFSSREIAAGELRLNDRFRVEPKSEWGDVVERTVLTVIVISLVVVIGYWLYALVRNAEYGKGRSQ